MKQKIIVTNIPAFYKIRLYNEVNKKVHLTVIFTDAIEASRNKDFVDGTIEFDYKILRGSMIKKISTALSVVQSIDYDELILGGWDHPVRIVGIAQSNIRFMIQNQNFVSKRGAKTPSYRAVEDSEDFSVSGSLYEKLV